MTTTNEIAGDRRRAAALISHHANRDVAGMNAVMADANEAHRTAELVLGILFLYDELIPELRTELAREMLTDHILRLAVAEADG